MAPSRRSSQSASWGLAQTQQLFHLLATSSVEDVIARHEQEIDKACYFLEQADVARLMAAELLLEHLCLSISKACARLVPQLMAGPCGTENVGAARSVCTLMTALHKWIRRYMQDREQWSPAAADRIAGTGGYHSAECDV